MKNISKQDGAVPASLLQIFFHQVSALLMIFIISSISIKFTVEMQLGIFGLVLLTIGSSSQKSYRLHSHISIAYDSPGFLSFEHDPCLRIMVVFGFERKKNLDNRA
jgi:hypothetical protein